MRNSHDQISIFKASWGCSVANRTHTGRGQRKDELGGLYSYFRVTRQCPGGLLAAFSLIIGLKREPTTLHDSTGVFCGDRDQGPPQSIGLRGKGLAVEIPTPSAQSAGAGLNSLASPALEVKVV